MHTQKTPVDVSFMPGNSLKQHLARNKFAVPPPYNFLPFLPILKRAPTWMQELWGFFGLDDNILNDMREHLKKPIEICTDGGSTPFETFSVKGWVFANKLGDIFHENGGVIGGISDDQDSFIAEADAALSVTTFFNHIETHGVEVSDEKQFWCDNNEVTKIEPSTILPTTRCMSSKSHYGIRVQLAEELTHLRVKGKKQFGKVKGHQDRKKKLQDLTVQERLNVAADAMCHKVYKKVRENPSLIPSNMTTFLPKQIISIRNPLHRLARKTFNESHRDSRYADTTDYLCNKRFLDHDSYNKISWNALSALSRSLRHFQRRKYQKILYKQWMNFKRLHSWKFVPSPLCFFCKESEETNDHIITCNHPIPATVRLEAYQQLDKTLYEIGTPKFLASIIIHGIKHKSIKEITIIAINDIHPYLEKEIKTAIQHQDDIGWNNITTGFIAEAWIHVIKAYKKHLGIKDLSPENWMRRFLQASLDWPHHIWKSRCTYVHESDRSSLNCLRQVLFNKWTHLLENRHELGYHTFLLKRQGNFFFTATKHNLELWESRITKAIQATKRTQPQTHKTYNPSTLPLYKKQKKVATTRFPP